MLIFHCVKKLNMDIFHSDWAVKTFDILSLSSYQCVVIGSNPAHKNIWDTLRASPTLNIAIEMDVNSNFDLFFS